MNLDFWFKQSYSNQKKHVKFVFYLQVYLNVQKLVSPGVDCVSCAASSSKECKEVYNMSQQSNTGSRRSSTISSENLRTEILDRIGEQQYEDVLFKPKQRKKKNKTKQKKMFVSGAESGSDTMSTSSVRSMSDGEDQWSSERLDVSSDLSISTKPSNAQLDTRSSSEETLGRLGDSISNNVETHHGGSYCEQDGKISYSYALDETGILQNSCKGSRPSDLCLGEECSLPSEIQPDLRSPESIERDVANKEKILAKVLKLDSLCDEDLDCEKHSCDINKVETQQIIEKIKLPCTTSHNYILSEELTHGGGVGEQQMDDWESQSALANDKSDSQQDCHDEKISSFDSQDEKLASFDSQEEKVSSFNSILSYGPPSGSSAPPSNHTSLETFSSLDFKTEPNCGTKLYEAVERSDQWMQYSVPGTIVNLSVCKYYVCCVDAKGVVYYSALNGLSLKWQKVDYKAKQVAISQDGTLVWRLHKFTAYALENPSIKGPFGGRWKEVAGNVQWISVADKTAWFISDGCISVYQELSSEHPSSGAKLVDCSQPVTRVCCFQDSVIVLTLTGEVLFMSGISHISEGGRKWKTVNVPCPVADVALGCHDTAWVVDQKNTIHFSCNFTECDAQWWQVSFSFMLLTYMFRSVSTITLFPELQESILCTVDISLLSIQKSPKCSLHFRLSI